MHAILVIAEETTGKLLKKYLQKGNLQVEATTRDGLHEITGDRFAVAVIDSARSAGEDGEFFELLVRRFGCRRIVHLRSMEHPGGKAETSCSFHDCDLVEITKPFKLSVLSGIIEKSSLDDTEAQNAEDAAAARGES